MKIFIAGASGVIGRAIIPLLVRDGHEVLGMTRTESKVDSLESSGAEAVVCDVYDFSNLKKVVTDFKPDVVMNELTDLPDDQSLIPETAAATSRIRREGTKNLLNAISNLNDVRFICQSVAWDLPGKGGEAVKEMEHLVLKASGIVLRYGRLYGPGTYYENGKPEDPRIHITQAAEMTLEALTLPNGIYLAAEPNTSLASLVQS